MDSPEEQAFIEAYDTYADALFRHAYFRLSDRDRAHDLAQETFFKAWDYLAGGGEITAYKSFLYRILHNLIIDEYRKKKSRSLDELLDDESKSPAIEALMAEGGRLEREEQYDDALLAARVRERMKDLPEHFRTVLLLRFTDGLSTGEIAAMIGESENVVSVRIHRGIAKLRELCAADDV